MSFAWYNDNGSRRIEQDDNNDIKLHSRVSSKSKRVVITFVTEGSSIDFLEGSLGKLTVAVGATEVFRMILVSDSCHTTTRYRLTTLHTQTSTFLVVMLFTQWMTVVFEETAAIEVVTTHLTTLVLATH